MKGEKEIILVGALVGALAIVLVQFGNAANYGLCIACFLRDTVGALGLHRVETVQYIRPEIQGIVLGAFLMAFARKEYYSRGGSSPLLRFLLGAFIILGALMFLGCPLRMVLRLAGGDLNAIFGLAGFWTGIVIGVYFLNHGFALKRSYKLTQLEGYIFPAANAGLFILLLTAPAFIFFSAKGPGASHAPVWLSLAAGLLVGLAAQKTRLCTVGGIRDWMLFKDWRLLSGVLAIFITALVGNLLVGKFTPGFINQSIAHSDGLWNFLGMALAGWGSVLLGGCPLRQLILSGEGNIDSVITVLGMMAGAAFAHNFGLASSAKGPTLNGQFAVLLGFVVLLIVSYVNREKISQEKSKGADHVEISRN